jgi:uncharacterized protein Yka (UPF0111/DUF47 family)
MSDKKKVSDAIMVLVDNEIKAKEDLGDLPRGKLVKMIYQITNRLNYWEFVKQSKVFEQE